jgi:Methylase involved in ubiquinone/menaquinone biosynthesis
MESKGRAFAGMSAGKSYDLLAPLWGMGRTFYEKIVADIEIHPGMRILDLGCGTGKLLFTLAKKSPESLELHGCDYSPEQTAYAEQLKTRFRSDIAFTTASMDEVNLPDAYFDLIFCSMALHAVNNRFHKSTICNVARMLRPAGKFVLVDINKSKSGIFGTLFSLMHREDQYIYDPVAVNQLIEQAGFLLESVECLNSLVARQIFIKTSK